MPISRHCGSRKYCAADSEAPVTQVGAAARGAKAVAHVSPLQLQHMLLLILLLEQVLLLDKELQRLLWQPALDCGIVVRGGTRPRPGERIVSAISPAVIRCMPSESYSAAWPQGAVGRKRHLCVPPFSHSPLLVSNQLHAKIQRAHFWRLPRIRRARGRHKPSPMR